MGTYKDIIAWQKTTGVPARVTSTIRAAGSQTAAGNTSCHAADNTRCDAVDFAGPSWGRDTAELGRIFWSFEPVFHLMHELIYAGPQTTFNIKGGKKVAKYAQDGHHDHVHAAILTATHLPMPPPPQPTHFPMEDDMPTVTARKIVTHPTRSGVGYILDSHGGIHAVGPAVKAPSTDAERQAWKSKGWALPPYWKPEAGIAPAIDLDIRDWEGPSGYVLDVLGGLHAFGDPAKAPAVPADQRPYWSRGFVPPTVQM